MDHTKVKAEWTWRFFMGLIGTCTLVMIGVIGWFLREAYASQQNFNAQIAQRVTALEMRSADISIIALDKRVTLNERAISELAPRLDRIDAKQDLQLRQLQDIQRNIK